MKIHVESIFDCSPEQVWQEVQTSRLLMYVLKPLVRFVPARWATFPDRWEAGGMIRGNMYILGHIPLGTHAVHFEKIDHTRRQIQTREYSPFFQQFDHRISVQRTDDGRTRYSDTIEIYAGVMTLLACFMTWCLFQFRHWRWKTVAARLAHEENQRRSRRARQFSAALDVVPETQRLDTGAITVRAVFPTASVLMNH